MEIELRYNSNHDEKGRFCLVEGGGRLSSSSEKMVDNSEKSDKIKETDMFYTEDDPLREVIGSVYENLST